LEYIKYSLLSSYYWIERNFYFHNKSWILLIFYYSKLQFPTSPSVFFCAYSSNLVVLGFFMKIIRMNLAMDHIRRFLSFIRSRLFSPQSSSKISYNLFICFVALLVCFLARATRQLTVISSWHSFNCRASTENTTIKYFFRAYFEENEKQNSA
jgi:hypothetical protein